LIYSEAILKFFDSHYLKEVTMAKETKKRPCPTCMGKGVIAGICETSGEWQGKTEDGQICTPDQSCPTCKGKGYVED
jgi:hypothetical protein